MFDDIYGGDKIDLEERDDKDQEVSSELTEDVDGDLTPEQELTLDLIDDLADLVGTILGNDDDEDGCDGNCSS